MVALAAACSDAGSSGEDHPWADALGPDGAASFGYPGPSSAGFSCVGGSSVGQQGLECSGALGVRRLKTGEEVLPEADLVVHVTDPEAGIQEAFTLRNSKVEQAATIVLGGVELAYQGPELKQGLPAAVRCVGPDGQTPCGATQWRNLLPVDAVPGLTETATTAASQAFSLVYEPVDEQPRTAIVRVHYVPDDGGPEVHEFALTFEPGRPALASVETLDFGLVAPAGTQVISDDGSVGEATGQACETIALRNLGDAPLRLSRFALLGAGFSVLHDGVARTAGEPIHLMPPVEIAPAQAHDVQVCFAPADDKGKQGELVVFSNDPTKPDAKPHRIALIGNAEVPCLKLQPSASVDMGGVLPGTCETREVRLVSCGAAPLVITDISALVEAAPDTFSYDFQALAGACGQLAGAGPVDPLSGPSPAAPCVLGPNEQAPMHITYCPESAVALDPDTGEPASRELLSTRVASNAWVTESATGQPSNIVHAWGHGVASLCPQAVVTLEPGEEVIPQTTITLTGDKSYAPGGGNITKYQWTAEQPPGAQHTFLPSATFPNPKMTLNSSGLYTFCLDVWDQDGTQSCSPACVQVNVQPDEAIHIELSWSTPADPDETDSGPGAGADMDLHFAHPLASGPDLDGDGQGDPWFSNPYDTFWLNSDPNWGSFNPAMDDDPSLDLDDTDGAGPENLNVNAPETADYAIGVHYWHDHGFGPSYAKVRIWVLGIEVFSTPDVLMQPLDMWFVGKLHWPNVVTGQSSKDPVTVCKYGPAPGGGEAMWQPAGAWCITPCYKPQSPEPPQQAACP